MRLKLIAGNLVVVLLVGLASYLVVRDELRDELTGELHQSIGHDSELLSRSWRLAGMELAALVSNRAAVTSVRQAFAAVGEEQRRRRAFDAAQSVAAWFQDPARGRSGKPTIVALIDETGRVVARDTDPNRMVGEPLRRRVPAVRRALEKGAPRSGVWELRGHLVQIGVAPVRNDEGGIVGALLVGYDLSNGFAQREARVLGQDVVFITGDRIYSASTSVGVRDALKEALYSPPLEAGTRAALQGKRSSPWSATLKGHEYVGVTAALPNSRGADAGFVVLANRTEQVALASTAAVLVLWITLLGLIGVAIYGFIVANSVMEPIEQMEDDILAVINGRNDVRLEVETPEFGGLSYRINQLINLFTGVAEEDDEGRAVTSSGGWAAVSASGPEGIVVNPSPVPGRNESDGGALAEEPEEDYYARLYREYLAAKQSVGEDVSNIPQERFVQRIKGNADHLASKHGARVVRFKVETIGGQVNLRPVVIH